MSSQCNQAIQTAELALHLGPFLGFHSVCNIVKVGMSLNRGYSNTTGEALNVAGSLSTHVANGHGEKEYSVFIIDQNLPFKMYFLAFQASFSALE